MGNKKSTTTRKLHCADESKQMSVCLKDAVSGRQSKIRMVQNVLLVWLDQNIDDSNANCRIPIKQLRHIVNNIETFTNNDECIEFLERMSNEKICMITSGSLGQYILPRVHNLFQVQSILIYCGNKTPYDKWAKEWLKIKGVFTDITPMCEALKQVVRQCEQDAIPINFMASSRDLSKDDLNELELTFVYTQIFKEILLKIKFEDTHFTEFIDYCRDVLVDKENRLKNVPIFEQNYHNRTPIWWYTCDCFLNPMLNRALRTMDVDVIIKMGFFIQDLHCQIKQLYQEQFDNQSSSSVFTVYRGQGMSKADFDQMSKTKGGLMSCNSFLSANKNLNVSLSFTDTAMINVGMVGVIFVITIDPTIKPTTPFASITKVSYSKAGNDEVLFSMNTVFRIDDITQMGRNHRLFQVALTPTSDSDRDLRMLTDYRQKETYPDANGWDPLYRLLVKMKHLDESQKPCEIRLQQTIDESEKGRINHQFGWIKDTQGKYKETIKIYEKALEIYKNTLSSTDLTLARCYNDIGVVYRKMGEYSKALSFHENALKIQQQSLHSNHPDLGVSYSNIGNVYNNMGEYAKALSSHEKALEIQQQSPSPNYSILSVSYNNIGNVYQNMGDYPKALSSYKKDLEISQNSLPPNHPDLVASFNNIASLYSQMGAYVEALPYFQKALEIQQQSLSPDHPSLAASFNNIGSLYSQVTEYATALPYFKQALQIQKQAFPSNHPDLATSYNNIGSVYFNTGTYCKALLLYEKALKIRQQSLPSNHPDLISSYNSIGSVYHSMNKYSDALSSYEKALEIQQQSLPPNHSDFGCTYNNIGAAYESMGEYAKAHSYYQRAVNIGEQSSLSNPYHLRLYRKNLENIQKNL